MVGDLLSILVKTKSIVKLSNTSHHSLCTPGSFNVPTASFDPIFSCYTPDHVFGSCPHKKFQKNIVEKKKSSSI